MPLFLSYSFIAHKMPATKMFSNINTKLLNANLSVFTSRRKCSSEIVPRVFSGIQPTGIPHIGNYFGAIDHWVKLQNSFKGSIIFSIVDLHSITVPQDPKHLQTNILDMAACLIACGIKPDKSIFFQQSTVSYHAELAWILGCLTSLPKLEHLPQWKEKSASKDGLLGIFTYPVLQSADILIYRATHVPVGDDQVKHIELTGHLAKAFNRIYKTDFFPKPKAILGEFKRIKSLRKIGSKMSKSEENTLGRIELNDSPDEINLKIRKAVTDMTPDISYDPSDRPGISNLIEIYSAFTNLFPEEIVEKFIGKDTVQFKNELADIIIEKQCPIRNEMLRLQNDVVYLQNILKGGAERANEIAETNYKTIRKLVGLC